MADNSKIIPIIVKYALFKIDGQEPISEQEQKEVDAWISLSERNQRLFSRLTDPSYIIAKLERLNAVDVESGRADLIRRRLKRSQRG